jgi:hypothetical protein
MSLMHRLRRRSDRLARFSAGVFVLVWLAIVATPCAMAMQFGEMPADHDCPHCPPAPCHELAPEDCKAPESVDSPRLSDKTPQFDAAAGPPLAAAPAPARATRGWARPPAFSSRAGPPPYLLHLRFLE